MYSVHCAARTQRSESRQLNKHDHIHSQKIVTMATATTTIQKAAGEIFVVILRQTKKTENSLSAPMGRQAHT
jgi:hypothetical protein